MKYRDDAQGGNEEKFFCCRSSSQIGRSLQAPEACIECPHFRAVSAFADTARNRINQCFAAFYAAKKGGQQNEQRRRDI